MVIPSLVCLHSGLAIRMGSPFDSSSEGVHSSLPSEHAVLAATREARPRDTLQARSASAGPGAKVIDTVVVSVVITPGTPGQSCILSTTKHYPQLHI